MQLLLGMAAVGTALWATRRRSEAFGALVDPKSKKCHFQVANRYRDEVLGRYRVSHKGYREAVNHAIEASKAVEGTEENGVEINFCCSYEGFTSRSENCFRMAEFYEGRSMSEPQTIDGDYEQDPDGKLDDDVLAGIGE